MNHANNFPKLHNAAWPGVVGKGSPGAEAFIDLANTGTEALVVLRYFGPGTNPKAPAVGGYRR